VSGVPLITFFPAVAAAAYLADRGQAPLLRSSAGWSLPISGCHLSIRLLARDQWITFVIYAFLSGLLVLLTHKHRRVATRANEAA